ncbi:hypothetical protein GY45DRAFT_1054052 [Cubamyces sp. BRFM 1775]|nr:hypothetical protein GY45DRAFT_1054052 [Cubamyces sp. BRFM 1775]
MPEDEPIIMVGPSLPPAPPPSFATNALPQAAPQAHRELVPEPPYGRNRSFMGFIRPGDLPKYMQAKDVIKRLVRNILDASVSWRFQEAHAVERLKAKILRLFPMFKEYEGAWPMMYYAYQKLGDMRRCLDWREKGPMGRRVSARILSKRCICGAKMGATRASGCAVVQVGATGIEPPAMVEDLTAATDEHGANDRQRGTACLHGAAPSGPSAATGIRSSSRPDRGEGPYSPSGKRLAAMIELAKQDERDVLDFLCGVSGTFAYLFDRFRVAGLTSRARLVALARWNAVDLEAFLASEVRLSAFERKAVKVALGKLVG